MQRDLAKIPRRRFRRGILRVVGRFAIRLMTKFEIEGKENIPETGPYILAGNHVSAMEVILMALFSKHQIEILGAGDIPLDPNLAPFASYHGFIPINRGSVDQTALKLAARVLDNDGVIGIFPEGGIWSQNIKQAKVGVSWISYRTKSPVVPIGFSGMYGALRKMLRFRRPTIKMHIGKLIKFDDMFPVDSPYSKKDQLQVAADLIMNEITMLLPEEERIPERADDLETKKLKFEVIKPDSVEELVFDEQDALSAVLTHPVIMDVFNRNLKLPVKCLLRLGKPADGKSMHIAVDAICNYLDEHETFLIYRFGTETGRKMEDGLRDLLDRFSKLKDNKDMTILISEIE